MSSKLAIEDQEEYDEEEYEEEEPEKEQIVDEKDKVTPPPETNQIISVPPPIAKTLTRYKPDPIIRRGEKTSKCVGNLAPKGIKKGGNIISNLNSEDMLEVYRDRMFEPTSKKDLEYMLDGKVKIVTYNELDNFNDIQELLDPYQATIILYPNHEDPNFGHWICIFRMCGESNNILQYFDPYGAYVDEPISDFNEKAKTLREPQRMEPRLIDLILNSIYKDTTEWNECPFQSDEIAVSTCGLWNVMRLKNNHLNEHGFKKQFYDAPRSMNILPDLLVSAMVVDLYPEMAI